MTISLNNHIKKYIRFIPTLLWVLLGIWVLMHVPGVMYGTVQTPLQESYVSTDEQASVNSALRVLNERSIFAFRNRTMQYYGPLMVMADVPGVAADFVWKYVTGVARTGEEYKRYIIWDWGGINRNIRLTALASMTVGIIFVYLLMSTRTINLSESRFIPTVSAVFVAVNYYYFQYSHFGFHWAYILPLLFIQLYTFVRIYETEGAEKNYWVWHAVATVMSFGVSYFSAIFLSMWIPWLYGKLRERYWFVLKRFIYTMSGVFVGWGLVIWWHPFAFIRYLSFFGIGEQLHNNGDTLNPLAFSGGSFGYYAQLILVNHLSIVALFLLLVFVIRTRKPWQSIVFWALLLPGMLNFVMFSLMTHAEGRYVLPTIISLLLATAWMLAQYFSVDGKSVQTRLVTLMIGTLMIWYVGFHFIHDIVWMHIFSLPPLREEIIKTALVLQDTGAPVLIINETILGHPHTIDSYRAYATYRGFGDIPLYKEIYANPLPQDKEPLDARYLKLADYEQAPGVIRNWKHVIFSYHPRQGEWGIFNYFDENITRNWYHRELSDTYTVLK